MANTMRWRYGDTSPVMLPVDSATVIEIGDLVYLDTDDAKPAGSQPDQGTEPANQQLFHDMFAGVAMQASRERRHAADSRGDDRRVRVRLREHDARSRRPDGRRRKRRRHGALESDRGQSDHRQCGRRPLCEAVESGRHARAGRHRQHGAAGRPASDSCKRDAKCIRHREDGSRRCRLELVTDSVSSRTASTIQLNRSNQP